MDNNSFPMDCSMKTQKEIANYALDFHDNNPENVGILLCEGTDTSIDQEVYSIVFPDLLVIPVGGCSTVSRLLPRLRNMLSVYRLYVFGIIDRDALSKKEIKSLYEKSGLYVTKLPFIENIICTPEVLKIVCRERGLDYKPFLKMIEEEMMKILWQKLKETLPINLAIDKREKILRLSIGAATKKKTIQKDVTSSSILYSYRDKIITSIIASHLGIQGKKAYYAYISSLIANEMYRDDLAKAFSNFIPLFEVYDF